jgi:hypothetical protein
MLETYTVYLEGKNYKVLGFSEYKNIIPRRLKQIKGKRTITNYC